MEIAWPGYFSSLDMAQPIPQTGHAHSVESWASIRAELPALAAEWISGYELEVRRPANDGPPVAVLRWD